MGLTAIVIGATGVTGSSLIKRLSEDDRFDTIKIFTRRQTDFAGQKIQEFVIDFDAIESFKKELTGDILFSLIGTTQKEAKSKKMQHKVDFSYQYEVAKASAANKVQRLILLSTLGANEQSNNFYLCIKGALNDAVANLPFYYISIFKPSFIEAKRIPFRLGETIGIFITKILQYIPLFKRFRPIKVEDLAKALHIAATTTPSERLQRYEVDDIFDLLHKN